MLFRSPHEKAHHVMQEPVGGHLEHESLIGARPGSVGDSAAVVVGGTSLSGGEGKVLGTLVGALIIAVIQNGMNLTNVESYTQKVVLGSVILAAVLLDRLKRSGS